MAVTRTYTGDEGRHYPFLPLADGTVGWTASRGTVDIATADDVPDDGRFDTPRKKTAAKKTAETPEPAPVEEPAATSDEELS